VSFVKRFRFIGIGLISLLGACAQPTLYDTAPMSQYDQHTKYMRNDSLKGFTVNVIYERYQFIPESDAVALACKQAATALVFELADAEGRMLKPINHDRIRLSMGRNGVTGITSCSISVPVFYEAAS